MARTAPGGTITTPSDLIKETPITATVVDARTAIYAKRAAYWQRFQQFAPLPNEQDLADTIMVTKGGDKSAIPIYLEFWR